MFFRATCCVLGFGERTTAGCERHNRSGLGRLVGDLCSQNSGFLDGLRQLVCDGGWTMHAGVSRCPVNCVLLSRSASVFRSARDHTHSRVIHCPSPCAILAQVVCDCTESEGVGNCLSLAVYSMVSHP